MLNFHQKFNIIHSNINTLLVKIRKTLKKIINLNFEIFLNKYNNFFG